MRHPVFRPLDVAMAGSFAQLVAFGTDIVGLERFLRFVQATLLILTSHPAQLSHVSAPAAALSRRRRSST